MVRKYFLIGQYSNYANKNTLSRWSFDDENKSWFFNSNKKTLTKWSFINKKKVSFFSELINLFK